MATITVLVADVDDDGETYGIASGNFANSGSSLQSFLRFGNFGAGTLGNSWVRFTGLSSLAGGGITVTSAYLTGMMAGNVSEGDPPDTCSVDVYGTDADAPSQPTNPSGVLPYTTAAVSWAISGYPTNVSGDLVTSPDIKTVIQEIIDRAGFTGESMILNLVEVGGSDDNQRRSFWAKDAETYFPGESPIPVKLVVNYEGSFDETGIGAIVLSGSPTIDGAMNDTGRGEFVLGGSPTLGVVFGTEDMIGGLTIGGASTIALKPGLTAIGGVSLGGSATIEKATTITPSGGVDLVASVEPTSATNNVGSGNLTIGGSSVLNFQAAETFVGGLAIGGSATLQLAFAATPDGELTLGGSAPVFSTVTQLVLGGLSIAGTVSETSEMNETGSGPISLGGVSANQVAFVASPSGGLIASGSSPVFGTMNEVSIGSVQLGGSESAGIVIDESPTGGIQIGGTSIVGVSFSVATAGAVDLSTTAFVFASFNPPASVEF